MLRLSRHLPNPSADVVALLLPAIPAVVGYVHHGDQLFDAVRGGEHLADVTKGAERAGDLAGQVKTAERAADATPVAGRPHGNTAGNQPATLYEKYDAQGNFMKHGVSQNPDKRYTKGELGKGFLKKEETGPRKEMLRRERERVEINPGPENREPWAGKKRDQDKLGPQKERDEHIP